MKSTIWRRFGALLATAGLVGSLLATVVAPGIVLGATDPGCTTLGGNDGTGTCVVSLPVGVGVGPITVLEDLQLQAALTLTGASLTLNVGDATHPADLVMDGGSSIVGPGKSITINVPNGDMTMHSGATITTTVTSGAAGPITINVGNYAAIIVDPTIPPKGVFTMDTGSLIEANGGPSGVGGDIAITAGYSGSIDGHVLSQVNSGSSGGTGRDGASIFVDTGCGLTVSETGVLSSRGMDQGADLVHLSSCKVTIAGLVESTGAGHGVPGSPFNHCDHAFRPDKPANATGCVEVWADLIEITNTGEINADINSGSSGGPEGESWIDLFANTDISITGRTSGTFSVHADSYEDSDNTPNTITVKAVNGTFTGSDRILSASDTGGNGSWGGDIIVEASGLVTLASGTVMAAGDNVGGGPPAGAAPCDGGSGACGTGGTIAVRSFNAAVTWLNGVGDVNPDRPEANPLPPNAGTISLTACTTVTTTGTNFYNAVPTVSQGVLCGGLPSVPPYVDAKFTIIKPIWAVCNPASLSGVKWHDHNGNHIRDVGDEGLEGWHILITDGAGGNLDIETDATGAWTTPVPAGTYTVCEVLQPTWVQTFPTSGTACAGSTLGYTVTVTTGGCCPTADNDITGLDFGNFKEAHKLGIKFKDVDNSGTKNAGDTPLGGWPIDLLTTGNVVLASTTTSAADGSYSFTITAAGTYRVCEAPASCRARGSRPSPMRAPPTRVPLTW